MALLGTLLPGLRDARTPMSVGALWLLAILLATRGQFDSLSHLDAADDVTAVIDLFPTSVRFAGLVAGVYLLGMVMQGLMVRLVAPRLWRAIDKRLDAKIVDMRITAMVEAVSTQTRRVHSLLESTIRERLRPISETVALFVPSALLLDEFELASMRLGKEAPEQFQQYDRLRSEAELRRAVALPLLVVSEVLAFRLTLWLGVLVAFLGVVVAAYVAYDGIQQSQRADELLASAIYFGYASAPILDNLMEAAKAELPSRPGSKEARDLAWLCDFLAARGLLTTYSVFLSRLRHPSWTASPEFQEALSLMGRLARSIITDALTNDDNASRWTQEALAEAVKGLEDEAKSDEKASSGHSRLGRKPKSPR